MPDTNHDINPEKMGSPSIKLLVTTPMTAIMLSGKNSSEWPALLQSIAPIYADAANKTQGDISQALLTVSKMLESGDTFIKQFFSKEELNFDSLMETSAMGADVWMCKLSDGDIQKSDAVHLFKAIQTGLIATVGELRSVVEIIDQLIQIQDKVIEHISSLN